VFEAVMLWGLTPALSTPAVLIGLVAYRLVYFLLPLGLATAIWVWREARRWYRRHRAGECGGRLPQGSRWDPSLALHHEGTKTTKGTKDSTT
jgi:hypothetical protein